MTRWLVAGLLFVLGCNQARKPEPAATVEPVSTATNSADAIPEGKLGIGSSAPALHVEKFLQGDPVARFEPGKIYVVEFWATWCGPCVQAMPHISELQKRHPEVTFIGVNVWEDDASAAETFLKQNGERVTYRIARDKIAPGASAQTGAMVKAWLEPADVRGIPTAFVIDKKGRIAEITHPMELDSILPKIIDGSWDANTARQQKIEQQRQAQRQQQAIQKLQGLALGEASEAALQEIDETAKDLPPQYSLNVKLVKLHLMSSAPEFTERALEEARALVATEQGKSPQMMNGIAWGLVSPERPKPATKELQQFALDLARKADVAMKEQSGAVADTLARALFVTGDAAAAIDVQKRSLALFEKERPNAAELKELRDRLSEYEQAAKPAADQ